MSWNREDHYARIVAQHPATRFDVIDITPASEALINRRVTREQLERHHARRNQVIELRALEEAQRALEPMAQTWWARLARALRGLMGGAR
jgi:hypothetical protein